MELNDKQWLLQSIRSQYSKWIIAAIVVEKMYHELIVYIDISKYLWLSISKWKSESSEQFIQIAVSRPCGDDVDEDDGVTMGEVGWNGRRDDCWWSREITEAGLEEGLKCST